jgi:hypothetical protein
MSSECSGKVALVDDGTRGIGHAPHSPADP